MASGVFSRHGDHASFWLRLAGPRIPRRNHRRNQQRRPTAQVQQPTAGNGPTVVPPITPVAECEANEPPVRRVRDSEVLGFRRRLWSQVSETGIDTTTVGIVHAGNGCCRQCCWVPLVVPLVRMLRDPGGTCWESGSLELKPGSCLGAERSRAAGSVSNRFEAVKSSRPVDPTRLGSRPCPELQKAAEIRPDPDLSMSSSALISENLKTPKNVDGTSSGDAAGMQRGCPQNRGTGAGPGQCWRGSEAGQCAQ